MVRLFTAWLYGFDLFRFHLFMLSAHNFLLLTGWTLIDDVHFILKVPISFPIN